MKFRSFKRYKDRVYAIPFGRFSRGNLGHAPENEVLIGREVPRSRLIDYLTNMSSRGAFLVTGRRGVGKSAFVDYCLTEFERANFKRFVRSSSGRSAWDLLWIALFTTIAIVVLVLISQMMGVVGSNLRDLPASQLFLASVLGILLLFPALYGAKVIRLALEPQRLNGDQFSGVERSLRVVFNAFAVFLPVAASGAALYVFGSSVNFFAVAAFLLAGLFSLLGLIFLGRAIILAHPDVGSDQFAEFAKSIKPLVAGLTLYSNANDWALWMSNKLNRAQRAGGSVLVVPSVETIDTSSMGSGGGIKSLWPGNWNHDVFVRNPILFGEITRLLLSSARPPHKRTSAFQPVTTKSGTYWKFAPPDKTTAN